MATLAIADKPTLDAVKKDTTDILNAITGAVGLSGVNIFILDYVNDEVVSTHGAIDRTKRIATT